jgi:uncharacterized protein (TIGR03792 family)
MVIEWLKIKVDPKLRESYIQRDAEIWNSFLAKYPGFLGKEVWINPESADEVILVIRWASQDAWDSVPSAELTTIEQQFDQAMGPGSYELVESRGYQIRKFPQSS